VQCRRYPRSAGGWLPIAWIAGLAAFVVMWTLIAKFAGALPDPVIVVEARRRSSADPFYSERPNDPGIA